MPFQVYTAALVLFSHLEQNDAGVSVWGFALLTKPLILTVSVLHCRTAAWFR